MKWLTKGLCPHGVDFRQKSACGVLSSAGMREKNAAHAFCHHDNNILTRAVVWSTLLRCFYCVFFVCLFVFWNWVSIKRRIPSLLVWIMSLITMLLMMISSEQTRISEDVRAWHKQTQDRPVYFLVSVQTGLKTNKWSASQSKRLQEICFPTSLLLH